MADDIIIPPPDTPPTQTSLMQIGVAGAVTAMAAGTVDLAIGLAGDCLTLLNLILGLLELGIGAALLWWVISQWLKGTRAALDVSRKVVLQLQQHQTSATGTAAPREHPRSDQPPGGPRDTAP